MSEAESVAPVVDEPKKGKKKAPWVPKEAPTVGFNEAFDFKDKEGFNYIRTAQERNLWYYRDRLSVPRGPCTLPTLREAWSQGVIDEHTLIWGQGQMDWLPIRNVRMLTGAIRTPEVRLATWFRKTFVLQPQLEKIREQRSQTKTILSNQVDLMQ